MGLTYNNIKKQRIIKGNTREKLFISVNWDTNILAYWRNKIPDLLDFFVTNGISSKYTDIQLSYDLTSDHSPIIATLSTSVIVSKPTPRLHNSTANWDTNRQIIKDEVNLSIKLKKHGNIELHVETNKLVSLLQHAAKKLQPKNYHQRKTNNIPYQIKKLVAVKREEPGQSGKELTHKIAEEYTTEQATNLNQNSMKSGRNPLKNTSLISKWKITLLGNL